MLNNVLEITVSNSFSELSEIVLWNEISTLFSLQFSSAFLIAFGSISIPTVVPEPNFLPAMLSIPEPEPKSNKL